MNEQPADKNILEVNKEFLFNQRLKYAHFSDNRLLRYRQEIIKET